MTDNLIEETAAGLFRRHCPPELVTEVEHGGAGWSEELWAELESSGLAAAGAELEIPEAASVVRAAARFAAPVPLAETVLAAWLLRARGAEVPEGPLAVAFGGRAAYGRTARLVLTGEELRPPAECGLQPALNLAGEPLDTVEVPDAAGGPARLGALVRSAQLVGALERVLEMSAVHAEERHQFGVPLLRFQAVQRLLAGLAGEVAAAVAALECALEVPGELEVAAAKVRAGEAAAAGAALAHQLHGAIGMTEEHSLGLFTRRLWSWRDDFGGEAHWAARLGARLLADPARLWS